MNRIVLAKVLLGAAGLALGLVGMALEFRVLVWIAAGFLAVAVLLRFVRARKTP